MAFAVCLSVVVVYCAVKANQYGNISFPYIFFPSTVRASDLTFDIASSLGNACAEKLEFTWKGLREVQVVFRSQAKP